MSWLKEMTEKSNTLKEELADIDALIADSSKHKELGSIQYKLLCDERYHLKQYIIAIDRRIKAYCDSCNNCDICDDVTVHLVLG